MSAQAIYDKAQADRALKDADALRWVLADERGRRFIRRLLTEACGLDAPTVSRDRPIEHMPLWEGRRHVGIDLLAAIEAADQDAQERMAADAAAERAEARAITKAARAARTQEEKADG